MEAQVEAKAKTRIRHEWCILKHLLRSYENILEFIEDVDNQELKSKLLDVANEIQSTTVDYAVLKGNTARALRVIGNLIEAEYHCIERSQVNSEAREYLLNLALRIRSIRKKLVEILEK